MVWFYVPNVIDYFRLILLGVVAFTFEDRPILTCICFTVSALLDHVDGNIARWLNQCSRLGHHLDLVIDRVAEAIIMSILAILYPKLAPYSLLFIALDILSCWLWTAFAAEAGHYFKDCSSVSPLLAWYLRDPQLIIVCAFNNLFQATLYLYAFG